MLCGGHVNDRTRQAPNGVWRRSGVPLALQRESDNDVDQRRLECLERSARAWDRHGVLFMTIPIRPFQFNFPY